MKKKGMDMLIGTKKGQAGLTLIEVLVAVLLLGVIVGGMVGAYTLSRLAIIKAKHRMIAINLLRSDMELVMGQTYSTIEGWVTNPRPDDTTFSGELGANELMNPTRSTVVTEDTSTGILTVTIILNWTKQGVAGATTEGTDERLVTLISP